MPFGAGGVAPTSDDHSLDISGLVAGYEGIPVLHGITLSVPRGSYSVILGANGAGKTTLLRSIMGLAEVLDGDISYGPHSLRGSSTAAVVRQGIALAPEGRQLFSGLSVEDNLRSGSLVAKARGGFQQQLENVFEYFPVLRDRLGQPAGTLSGGEQQMLAIGRALMSRPSLLLVDEASLGLAPVMVERLFDLISKINGTGVAVLAVEQNVAVVDRAEFVFVLEKGRIKFGGPVDRISPLLQQEVEAAYLGR